MPAETITAIPWHQDAFYYGEGSEHAHILTFWIPLVDVDGQNGCLQVIPGSHGWGRLPSRPDPANPSALIPVDDVEARGEVRSVPMRAGDVLVFSQLTFHRSLLNTSDHVRWSIDLRYSQTGRTLDWLVDKWHGFTARSVQRPRAVASWAEWQASRVDSPA